MLSLEVEFDAENEVRSASLVSLGVLRNIGDASMARFYAPHVRYIAYMVPARAMFLMRADARSSVEITAFFLGDYVVMACFWMDAACRGISLSRGICAQNGWKESFLLDGPLSRRLVTIIVIAVVYTPLLDAIFCSVFGVGALQFTRISSLGLLMSFSTRFNSIVSSPYFSSHIGSSIYLSRPFPSWSSSSYFMLS